MNERNEPILDTYRRVLAELAEMAEHASMTRSLRGGEAAGARAFNGALAAFAERGLVPEGMFRPFEESGMDFGELAVQSRLLLTVLPGRAARNDDRLGEIVALAPFVDAADLGAMVRERLGGGEEMPEGFLVALAPFLDRETLGDLVRRNFRTTPPAPPQPKPEPVDHRPVFRSEPPPTIESLAVELRRPDLTMEERQAVAMRLAELSYEQSVQALE